MGNKDDRDTAVLRVEGGVALDAGVLAAVRTASPGLAPRQPPFLDDLRNSSFFRALYATPDIKKRAIKENLVDLGWR